jgi:hypothetical protein
MLLTPLQLKSRLVNFFVNLVKCDPYLITPEPSYSHFGLLGEHDPNCVLLDPAGHILVDLVKPDPNFVPLDPAGHSLVDLGIYDTHFVLAGPSWSHFGQFGQTRCQFRSSLTLVDTFCLTLPNKIPILFPLDGTGYILVDLVQHNPHNPNYVLQDPAVYILVNLVKHNINFVPPGLNWLHFGRLG